MSHNPDRFVIIDGVQTSRVRALRDGLIDESGRILAGSSAPSAQAPTDTRARQASSVRSSAPTAAAPAPAPAPALALAEVSKQRGGMFGKKPKAPVSEPTVGPGPSGGSDASKPSA